MRSSWGLPIKSVIIYIYSSSDVAGNKGFRVISSAKMQPTDHTSIAVEYLFQDKMTSGALYHLVAM